MGAGRVQVIALLKERNGVLSGSPAMGKMPAKMSITGNDVWEEVALHEGRTSP
jgi:hypothetical protein